jgi:hypothetical protein
LKATPFTAWVWPVSTRCGTRSAVFHAVRRGRRQRWRKRAVCVHRDGVRSVVVSDEVAEDLAGRGFHRRTVVATLPRRSSRRES